MHIQIDNSQTKVILSFTPAIHILVYDRQKKEWTLNYLIDRSEKGKDPDIGIPVVHLIENAAKVFKAAGFSFVEI